MDKTDVSIINNNFDLEVELLIQAIKTCYGIDFSHYKKASLHRRLKHNMEKNKLTYLSELIPKIIWDYKKFEDLLFDISIPVTEMFRDPEVYQTLIQKVLPYLKTYPQIRIWVAGCATGEEAYSLAILLKEKNCLQNVQIIATDFNKQVLEQAKQAVYSVDSIKQSELMYQKAGGAVSLIEYFKREQDMMYILPDIKQHILFLEHDLTSDNAPANIHLILCRNVFIYFDRLLQSTTTKLFYDSLYPGGFLCLGLKESLEFISNGMLFEDYVRKLKIYRKPYH